MIPRSCKKDILFCKCFDGITSQYCEILPKNCSSNPNDQIGQNRILTIAEQRRICLWSMGVCCPVV
uniref:EGF-like domain-containing protein n=1 Tax=Romanomermis culicivorax TaxID=13658 RepID=A0A915HNU8_ROMCU